MNIKQASYRFHRPRPKGPGAFIAALILNFVLIHYIKGLYIVEVDDIKSTHYDLIHTCQIAFKVTSCQTFCSHFDCKTYFPRTKLLKRWCIIYAFTFLWDLLFEARKYVSFRKRKLTGTSATAEKLCDCRQTRKWNVCNSLQSIQKSKLLNLKFPPNERVI